MKYEELITKMTLEEKASLLSGKGNFTTKPIERLGVPGTLAGVDTVPLPYSIPPI